MNDSHMVVYCFVSSENFYVLLVSVVCQTSCYRQHRYYLAYLTLGLIVCSPVLKMERRAE